VRAILVALILALLAASAVAQSDNPTEGAGPQPVGPSTTRTRIGVIVKASSSVFRAVATLAVPAQWPEQQVRIVNEEVSSTVGKLTYRDIAGGGGLKQMVVEIPQLAAGEEARALVTFEVTRSPLAAPADTGGYRIPAKLPRELLINVGPSPYIESRHPKIVAAAKEAIGDAATDWEKVEAIYDWTREHVTYTNGDLKGAARALYDKEAFTDDLTSVFVALCRANKIPARTVFVKGHCWAEFYLEDDAGEGRWLPCQPAGVRSFGSSSDIRPILQKGDNFKNPENPKQRLRWMKEDFQASGRGSSPKVKFVCEPVAE
jgi:transglutaminase-like putative cysteine protease